MTANTEATAPEKKNTAAGSAQNTIAKPKSNPRKPGSQQAQPELTRPTRHRRLQRSGRRNGPSLLVKEDILQPAPKISVDQAFIILKFKFAVQLNLAKDMQELKVQLENENGYNFETAQAYFDPLLIDYLW